MHHPDPDSSPEPSSPFNRLPQPYHLQRPQLQTSLSGLHINRQSNGPAEAASDGSKASRKGRSSGRSTTTPSESGTDADDESFAFTRALPAPPLRPRKGLREAKGADLDNATTPLLTPTKLEEDGHHFASDYFASQDTRRGDRMNAEERAARARFVKRRRAEILRRSAETFTLAAVGFAVGWRDGIWNRSSCLRSFDHIPDRKDVECQCESDVIKTHALIVVGLCLLYPVRLIAYAWKRTAMRKPIRKCLRLPASFDPAPLLYPPFLSVMVALSFVNRPPDLLMANIVLGIASLPTPLIPTPAAEASSVIHWAISELPLAFIGTTSRAKVYAFFPTWSLRSTPQQIPAETISSLFPLHQALVSFLHYLTATSLLPAELQLLSIALINLLLFSGSPYAVILGTLLWMGGLGVYVLCGRVVRWGIALARIPRWRLKRAARTIQATQSFARLSGKSWNFPFLGQHEDPIDSDADEDMPEQPKRPRLRIDTLRADLMNSFRTSFFGDEAETKSAVESTFKRSVFGGMVNGDASRKRRNTVPNLEQLVRPVQAPKRRKKSFGTGLSQSFLHLSPEQAFVRKWLYAAYVYVAIVALVLIPIRIVIAEFALDGIEPFGWAIGYLFAGVPQIREWAGDLKLDSWVTFPSQPVPILLEGRAEYLRQAVIGEANTRLLISAYCLVVLILGMISVFRLSAFVEVDTRRKVFHGMMVAMLLPSIYIDPAFIALALGLVLIGFLLLDLLRASQLPPLSKPIAYFLTPYVDGRDLRGPVVVSHIFLLIGCAVPLWLSLADSKMAGERPWEGWEYKERDTSMVSGVMCVGMGDAAASLIGRRYGRRKWLWAGGKSLEGSGAFALTVTIGLTASKVWMWLGQWDDRYPLDLSAAGGWINLVSKAGLAACVASFMEAVLTGGNDNVIVPVMLWLTVRALGL